MMSALSSRGGSKRFPIYEAERGNRWHDKQTTANQPTAMSMITRTRRRQIACRCTTSPVLLRISFLPQETSLRLCGRVFPRTAATPLKKHCPQPAALSAAAQDRNNARHTAGHDEGDAFVSNRQGGNLAARADRAAGSRTRRRRDTDSSRSLRRLPDRPACRRRRPAAAPPDDYPRS